MDKDLVRHGEVISGAVLAALGAYIFVQSRTYDYYTADGPGPGFFPTWYGVAMVVLSLALIITSVRKGGAGKPIDWPAVSRALGTWAAFAASVALMGTLGFVVSFALLTFCIVTFVFKRSPLTAGLTAVGAALVFHVVFPVILEVQLPTGLLGF
jgi:putative tricarboxylic transport membrane protein